MIKGHKIFEYVRESYGVPAHRNARVWYRGVEGRILWADSRIRVRFAVADLPEGHELRMWIPRRSRRPVTHITVNLHPCESTIAYDRETPPRWRPKAMGYFVWSQICFARGVDHYSPEGRAIHRELIGAIA